MQTYRYSAISNNGAKVNGVIEAFDEYAAVSKIKETCSAVLKIEEVRESRFERKDLLRARVSEKALSVMCSQFAIILGAGLPVVRAVELIAAQTTDRALKRVLEQAAGDVAAGFTLARSFENKAAALLPITFIETVRSGEESGTLEESFRRLHAYYNKSYRIKAKVRSAMVYPAFTMIVAVIVVAVIMVVAVPTFVDTFLDLGVELPLPTRMLIGVSNFFVNYWFVLALVLILFLLFWKLWGKSGNGRLTQDRWRLKYPVLGKIALMRAAAQFANTMNTMLAAGLPMVRAVTVTCRVLDNTFIGQGLDLEIPRMEAGRSLTECLRAANQLPPLLVEMAGVGEETGSLEHTFEVIGSYYDNETETRSQRALSLLEPIIICVLAVVVVFILAAVYLPMFSLYQNV